MNNKLKILFYAVCGELLKVYYSFGIASVPYGLNRTEVRSEKVTVSLTSYGRRVSAVLPYTIISLLRQTYKPDRIVLWLDDDHWNDDNLPVSLKRLKSYGLTIRYCKDIKSYKKLIPSLETFPEDIIITFDDDVYYKKDVVERLVRAYLHDPRHVYAHRVHRLCFSSRGHLLPYNEWEEEVSNISGTDLLPTGVGGCLYKYSMFHEDICRVDLFMQLAPKADDVWFYFMSLLKGTKRIALPDNGSIYIPLDVFYQFFHKDSSLSNINCKESQNDSQIREVMNYYHLTDADLR